MSSDGQPVTVLMRLAGLAKVLAILVAVVAPAVALAVFIGNPLPTLPIDWGNVSQSIRSGLVETTVWVNLIAVAAWIVWAVLVGILMAEVAAVVRDRPSRPSSPLWARKAAQTLVGASMLLSSPLGQIAAVAHDAPPPEPAATATVEGQAPTVVEAEPSPGTIEVEETATWSGLAEQLTGDPDDGPALLEANVGETMADGTVIDDDTVFVEEGWTVAVPDSVDTAAGPSGSVVAQQGDHLWQLAHQTLTDAGVQEPTDDQVADYWRQMLDLNRDRLGGDPDLIHPGDEIELPALPDELASAASAQPDPASEATVESDEVAAEDPGVSEDTETPTETGEAAGKTLDTEMATSEETADPDSTADTEESKPTGAKADLAPEVETDSDAPSDATSTSSDTVDQTDATPTDDPAVSAVPAPTTAGDSPPADTADRGGENDEMLEGTAARTVQFTAAGGIVAAGLLAGLYMRRRRRKDGTGGIDVADPDGRLADTEAWLEGMADPDTLWVVDRALRTIPADTDPAALSAMLGVHYTGDKIVVLLDRPMPAPEGWENPDGYDEWVLRLDRITDAVLDSADQPAPLPSLVTFGHLPSGMMMLDLHRMSVAEMYGPKRRVEQVMATLAVETASSTPPPGVQAVCVGFGDTLDELDRLHVCPTRKTRKLLEELPGMAANMPVVVFDPAGKVSHDTADLAVETRSPIAVVGGNVDLAADWSWVVGDDTIAAVRPGRFGLDRTRKRVDPEPDRFEAVADLYAAAEGRVAGAASEPVTDAEGWPVAPKIDKPPVVTAPSVASATDEGWWPEG